VRFCSCPRPRGEAESRSAVWRRSEVSFIKLLVVYFNPARYTSSCTTRLEQAYLRYGPLSFQRCSVRNVGSVLRAATSSGLTANILTVNHQLFIARRRPPPTLQLCSHACLLTPPFESSPWCLGGFVPASSASVIPTANLGPTLPCSGHDRQNDLRGMEGVQVNRIFRDVQAAVSLQRFTRIRIEVKAWEIAAGDVHPDSMSLFKREAASELSVFT